MKKLIFVLVAVLLLIGTVACAAPGDYYISEGAPEPSPAPAAIPAPTAPSEKLYVESPPVTIQVAESGAEEDYAYDSDESATIERMIIRTGYLVLVVQDVPESIEYITNLATTYGGFVVSSNSWQDRDRMEGNISIRVTVENFDNAITALRNLAEEVKSESTSGQDVTQEYTDLNSQLRNLEAAETQLLKLMEEETDEVIDILEVQRELVKTRGEIEQIKGRMQYLEQSSAMSLIQITLEQSKLTVEFTVDTRNVKEHAKVYFEPIVAGGFSPYSYEWDFGDGATSTEDNPSHAYDKDGEYTVSLKITDDRGNTASYQRDDYINVIAGWKASATARSAWNGLSAFGRFLVDLIIWLAYFSPLWIVIGIILYFTWWRKRKKKKE
jgi:PKD repeat protein